MQSSKDNLSLSALFISAIKSALSALVISVLLLAILCGVAFATPDPLSLVFPLSLAARYSACFISGFLCMKKIRKSPLLCGILSGGLLTLFYAFITLFLNDELSPSLSLPLSIALHSLVIIFSILGAYAGRYRTGRRRKLHR